jgi:CO/xanthine dehydrogenase Mo-binding subunit
MANFRTVGRPLVREDGHGKVTGAAQYTADVRRADTLWGKILRSPLPHARIVNVDASKAKKVRGVKAVITGQDVSAKLTGRTLKDLPVVARDRVRFGGDKVAAVAAIDRDSAEEALSLIEVEYEELPAIFDPLEAIKSNAILLHPDYASYTAPSASRRRTCAISKRHTSGKGRPRSGFSRIGQSVRAYLPHPDGSSGLYRAHHVVGRRRR